MRQSFPKPRMLPSQGFTLVEVMISLVILTMIMGLIFGALHLSTKSWRVGEKRNNAIEEQRLVSQYLYRQFSEIIPLFWNDARGSKVIFFGNAERIRFIGSLPINRKSGKLSLLELSVTETDSGKVLDLAYENLRADRSPFEEFNEEIEKITVLNLIETISFEYFGRQKSRTRPPQWSESWESRNELPELVKCTITRSDGRQWPVMIIPMKVDNTRGLRQFILQYTPPPIRSNSANTDLQQGGAGAPFNL